MSSTKLQVSSFSLLFLIVIMTTTLALWLFVNLSQAEAEIEKLQIHFFGSALSNYDKQQVRRLLSPFVEPKNVKFYTDVDRHGRELPYSTVVEITPDREYVKVYKIIRQLQDQRFKGKQAVSHSWSVKTEATITGNLFKYVGWSRSHIRHVPFWRRWQQTSSVKHAFDTGNMRNKIVFSNNEEYYKLIEKAGGGERVEIRGQIAGFDGPYPVMSVRKFRVEQPVEKAVEKAVPMKEKPEATEETPKSEN